MTKCPGEGICMTIIIVICAEIVNMVFRLAAQGGKRNPRMLSVGYTAAVGRAGARRRGRRTPRTGARVRAAGAAQAQDVGAAQVFLAIIEVVNPRMRDSALILVSGSLPQFLQALYQRIFRGRIPGFTTRVHYLNSCKIRGGGYPSCEPKTITSTFARSARVTTVAMTTNGRNPRSSA